MEKYPLKLKAKNFFEYLLALNNLKANVIRDFSEFERYWMLDEFEDLEGCFVLDECHEEENLLEIHRPHISEKEKLPPEPDGIFKKWLNFDYRNENKTPSVIKEQKTKLENDEEVIEKFADDLERESDYLKWRSIWTEWAEHLREKKRVLKIYETFFELISRFEKEGESLEFIYGQGLLYWKHPSVGSIRLPLLTVKNELHLDPDKGIISVKQVNSDIRFERDAFSGIQIPNIQQINALIENVQSQKITDDLTDFFNRFIRLLNANGAFETDSTSTIPKEFPIIYDRSIFILRNKNIRVLRDDLESILSEISLGRMDLPDTIRSILGEGGSNSEENGNKKYAGNNRFSSNNLYFPLPSNEQQKEIINRIERHYGVTVQGPPGTGKTHTIANLVSHFLAEGKRILITSQKENPLKVLKNKIPKEIRDLCVPVLGGGRESLQEIETSIRVIGEKLGELDPTRLSIDIQRDKEELDKSKRAEAQLKNQLKICSEKEGTELQYKGQRLFKYDVAKQLAESNISYKWIQDSVSMDVTFPFDAIEFQELWNLKGPLDNSSLLLKDVTLPVVNVHLQDEDSFKSLVNTGVELLKYDEKGQNIIESYHLPKNMEAIQSLLTDLKAISSIAPVIKQTSLQLVVEDCKYRGPREQRWHDFIGKMEALNEKLLPLYNQLITHEISLPEKDILTLKEEIKIVKERLQNGKKPNFLFYMGKGKQTKYLFESPILNGSPLKTIDDINPIEMHLQYEEMKREAARVFSRNMEEIGQPGLQHSEKRFPHLLAERLNEIKLIIEVIDKIKAVQDKYKEYKLEHVDLYSSEAEELLIKELELAIKHLQYRDWHKNFDQSLVKLQASSQDKGQHAILKDFAVAFEQKDGSKWADLLRSLQFLNETKRNVDRFYSLLGKGKSTLPLTCKMLELSVGVDQDFPADYLEAFELRKLQTWLDETKDINSTELRKQIDDEQKYQLKLINNIISNSTWKSQAERITDSQKRALSAWKTYIKKFGKGTGKYAQIHLQDARKEMKTAQGAIPVWIMPINQVMENFPITNEKFDVIIFDESSQCDLFSINILLRGKKVIVVGDDEQISPQSIGTNQEDVYELVRRHLMEIPNANLFDGNISMYEIAEQTFPKEGKLMLREHFRCVPEIIQFSNDLSYGGEMIPLRLPLEKEKIEPPVMAIKVKDGYNDEREKDINSAEVDAIVTDMLEMIDNPIYNEQTFGVITLQGHKQHKLLETRIREKIGDKEFVDRKIICGNPYTLQGDERDIIFLSMVIAPNRNFRAMTKTDEKQRFNVAASRARNQMRLYHSVDLKEMNVDDLRYRFLSYCKNPTRINEEVADLEDKCDSPFEVDVLRMILEKGYKVTPQVQVGRYRIDLVIEGLRDRLAVECDGEKWHGPEKFEEDLMRQESLERAGWKFWRIRGREFYFDRMKAMQGLWDLLDKIGIERTWSGQPARNVISNSAISIANKTSLKPAAKVQDLPMLKESGTEDVSAKINVRTTPKGVRTKASIEQLHFFDPNFEGYNDQINLFDFEENETYTDKQTYLNHSSFGLVDYLVSQGYEVIDQRDKGGNLWVIGDENLQSELNLLRSRNIKFSYSPNGSRTTKKRAAWYYK
ncbi:AAA domain-containing protein [Peribacillus sp. SCS-155]|uniref:AAA domain-containing protein n=1 Tax=Peribacillus sedimenti TaxID=3115297 RepID=UPI0039068EC1